MSSLVASNTEAGPWLEVISSDVMSGVPEIESESVDVAFFSPPYKAKDGWSAELMQAVGALLLRTLKPGGLAFMNFGQLKEDLQRPVTSLRMLLDGAAYSMRDDMIYAGQTIVWVKSVALLGLLEHLLEEVEEHENAYGVEAEALRQAVVDALSGGASMGHYQPLNTKKVLNYCYEYIFMVYKPPMPDLDRLAIGVPFKDKTNLKRGTRGQHGDVHCGGDVWFIPYKTTGHSKKKKHAYEFPEELVERALKLAGAKEGSVVLDMFFGSGTTGVVAKRLGLHCVGVERVDSTARGAIERWENAD